MKTGELRDYQWSQDWTDSTAPRAEASLRPAEVTYVGPIEIGYTESEFVVHVGVHAIVFRVRHNCQGDFERSEVRRELERVRLQIIQDARKWA